MVGYVCQTRFFNPVNRALSEVQYSIECHGAGLPRGSLIYPGVWPGVLQSSLVLTR